MRTEPNGSFVVRTDTGWLDWGVFHRYANASWSEGARTDMWRQAGGFGTPDPDDAHSPIPAASPQKVGDRAWQFVPGSPEAVPPVLGDKVTTRVRGGYTLLAHNSSGCTFSRITIHGASMMAITEFGGGGGHTYDAVQVVRRPLPPPFSSAPASTADAAATSLCAGGRRACFGVIASNADAFHSSACRRGPRLSNVELSFCLDDFINVHTRVQVVGLLHRTPHPAQGATGGRGQRLVLLDPRLSRDIGLPNDMPYGTAESLQHLRPGDNITFYALSTLTPLATRTVAAVKRFTDVANGAALATAFTRQVNAPPYNANPNVQPVDVCGLPGENCPHGYSRAWDVTLDPSQPALPHSVGNFSLVQQDGWDARGAVVDRCFFHDARYGFRWKSSASAITNSVIGGNRIEISPLQYYLEGPLRVTGVLVANNTFTCMGTAFSSAGPSGCTGGVHSGADAYARGTCSGILVRNNTFHPQHTPCEHTRLGNQ